jgi:hypothetical protein
MTAHVRIFFPDHLNLFHSSKLFTGISGLAQRGEIQFTLCTENPWNLDGHTLGMEVTQEGRVRKIAFDLRDRSTVWSPGALAACDVYFKRGFVRADVGALERKWQSKVVPFGLNFPCRGHGSSLVVFRRQLAALFRIGLRSLGGDRKQLREKGVDLRTYFATPAARSFVQGPETSVSPVVIFQTRLWEPNEVFPDDPDEINSTRAELVRVLRHRLGKQFWGGVMPTDFARRYYPDVVTDLPTHRREYIALCRRALIGVYSRGLHHSNAFKLSEYLAAAQAIVADPLTHELPSALQDGTHLCEYRYPEECAAKCAELLADKERVQAMRAANHAYYHTEVEPVAHLLRCMREAFVVPQATAEVSAGHGIHEPHWFRAHQTPARQGAGREEHQGEVR